MLYLGSCAGVSSVAGDEVKLSRDGAALLPAAALCVQGDGVCPASRLPCEHVHSAPSQYAAEAAATAVGVILIRTHACTSSIKNHPGQDNAHPKSSTSRDNTFTPRQTANIPQSTLTDAKPLPGCRADRSALHP